MNFRQTDEEPSVKLRNVTYLGVALAMALLFATGATAGCVDPVATDVWMVKSGGLWKDGDHYGNYRVILSRKGVEHARDDVQVQISRIEGRERSIVHCVDLKSPGLKGYVADIRIHSISEQAAAIELSIEMKAMEDIVLQDVFLVSADGSVQQIAEAKYLDLLDFPAR